MAELTVGKTAPEIAISTDAGGTFRLSAQRGKPVVLTFYSDGATEGCALQNVEFSALLPDFEKLGATVVAISPQEAKAGAAMRKKHKLGHIVAADTDLKAIKAYGLWAQKKLWGHEYMGVLRTSVIVGPDGKVAAVIKANRIKGHAQKVLEGLRGLVAG